MSGIHPVADAVVAFLIVLGGSFALIGSWGLARLPSLMTRLHGPTKATTLGVGSCLIASMVYFPFSSGIWSAHELLITLFLFIAAPISANMIAKAHLHEEREGVVANPADGVEALLPATGQPTDWATFWPGDQISDAARGPRASPEAEARQSPAPPDRDAPLP